MAEQGGVATRQVFELSNQDIRIAVKEYIERKFGKLGTLTISVRVDTVTRGYGMQEHESHEVAITATREVL